MTPIFRTLTSLQELRAIAPAWQQLWQASSSPTPFSSPDWIFTWIDHYWEPSWSLQARTAHLEDELVALLPVYVNKPAAKSGLSVIFPLGQGEHEAIEVASEYLDIVSSPSCPPIVLDDFASWLQNLSADAISWRASTGDSNIVALAKEHGLRLEQSGRRYQIDTSSWQPSAASGRAKTVLDRQLARLEKLGARFEWGSPDTQSSLWEALRTMHQRRWRDAGQPGALASTQFNDFHRDYRDRHPNSTFFSMLSLDDRPIALNYYLANDQTIFFYQSGWDLGHSKYSPGTALHFWSIENCDRQYYDFMMGGIHNSYKKEFGIDGAPMYTINHPIRGGRILGSKVAAKLKRIRGKLLQGTQ